MNERPLASTHPSEEPPHRPLAVSFRRMIAPRSQSEMKTGVRENPSNQTMRNLRLLVMLVGKDLRARYIGSVMGFFWSVIHPLLVMVLYMTVFAYILKVRLTGSSGSLEYGLYLVCGMTAWLPLQEIMDRSATVLLDNSTLIKKVVFPRVILPISTTVSGLINGLIAILLLTIMLLALGRWTTMGFLRMLVILPFQGLFALGLGLAVSSLNLFVRDVAQVVRALSMLWFFATPIVYTTEMAPQSLRFLLILNPLSHLTAFYRSVMLNQGCISIPGIGYFVICAVVSFAIGYRIFKRTESEFADLL